MSPTLTAIMIYARGMERTAAFYARFFDFDITRDPDGRLIELVPRHGGARIVVHQAARSVTLGQAGVKLMFAVPDVEAFKASAAALGLRFGATHQADGYAFANAKDPDRNSISISSRMFRR